MDERLERGEEPVLGLEPAAQLVICLGYRGGDFSGFAEQPLPGIRTVAGELRRALETYLRRPVELACAGRTDAGVHALAQYVSLPVSEAELAIEARRLERSLSAMLPDDISVRGLYRAPASFSARFDATDRSYRYRIACGNARPVHAWGHAWWYNRVSDLDVDAMQTAALPLVGEHDFRSFCKLASAELLLADGRSTCREITQLRVAHEVEAGEELVVVDVTGNAFLHNMVRILVGSLVEIGRGQRDASWLAEALAALDRRAAGPTAPACGLTLDRVSYPAAVLEPF